jgi:hypothetical protein
LPSNMWKRGRIRQLALLAALVGFAAGLYMSLRSNPRLLTDVRWPPLLVLGLVVTPVIQVLNAVEFYLTARLLGHRINFARCIEVTIIGSATNLLPLPGATLVRLAALKQAGATMQRGVAVTALLAAISLGIAFTYTGVWALTFGTAAFVAAGIGLLLLCAAGFASRRWLGGEGFQSLCLTRLGLVVADALRFLCAFAALGQPASFAQASVLAISTTLASILTLVPSGIGVREWIAALAAPLVGLQASTTFVAAALSQVAGLAIVLAAAAVLGLMAKPEPAT